MGSRNESAREKYLGKIYDTKNYGEVLVTGYENSHNVTVKFLNTNYITKVFVGSLLNGSIKDWSLPSVYNIGYRDCGEDTEGSHRKVSRLWSSILLRCYDKRWQINHQSYSDCTVSDNFKYFSKFKDWYYKQIGHDQEGWHLDKDILVKGNKVYSEETCCFVPNEINLLFVKSNKTRGDFPIGVSFCKYHNRFVANIRKNGTRKYLGYSNNAETAFYYYKEAKEAYIKEVANKWKDQIDIRTYTSLLNYKVEITD